MEWKDNNIQFSGVVEQIEEQPKVYEINLYLHTSGYIVSHNGKFFGYINLTPQHKLYTEDIQTINYNYGLELDYDLLDNVGRRHLGYKYNSLNLDKMKNDLDYLNERLFI
nr:MAG TPA: hypothetical protein [Ackermannviridae sp.]